MNFEVHTYGGLHACVRIFLETNEHGLTVNTVMEFYLVSPNGTQMVVTEIDKVLWFALKECLYMAMEENAMGSLLIHTTGRIW